MMTEDFIDLAVLHCTSYREAATGTLFTFNLKELRDFTSAVEAAHDEENSRPDPETGL